MIFRLPNDIKLIGPSLKELRIRLGVKQQDLVDAGVGSQSTVSALENGQKMPLFGTVLAYLGFLGCALDITRLNGEDIPEPRGFKRYQAEPRQKVYVPRPYKYRPRKSRAKPKPPPDPAARKRSPGFTSTGRCLGCFETHDKGEVFCYERQQSQAPVDGVAAVHPEDRQSIDEPSAGLQPSSDDHVVLGSALRGTGTDGLSSGAVHVPDDLGEVVICPSCDRQVNVTILGLIRPHRLNENHNGVLVSFRASPTGWCAEGGLPTEGLA